MNAQVALEYILLLTLAGVLSLPILISVNSQYAVQKQFGEAAMDFLANSTEFNSSSPKSGSYVNSAEPKLELQLTASQPAYVGIPAVIQATVYNYGSPTTLPLLKLESPNSTLSLSIKEKRSVNVSFSYALNSIVVPQAPGIYQIGASAIGEDGNVLKTADGKPLNATILLTVLPAQGGGWYPTPNYSIMLERSNESVSYNIVPSDEVIYTVSVWTVNRENDYCFCPRNAKGVWRFIEYSSSGTVYLRCACVYFTKQAKVGTISPLPRALFTIQLNATNATNASAGFWLNQDKLKEENNYGIFSITSPPTVSGVNPSSDSVVTSPLTTTQWTLRPISAYNDYKWARSDFEAKLAGVKSDCYSYDCNGAISAANRLNERVNSLLSAKSSYNCSSNTTALSCTPVSLSYPATKLLLNKSFVGATIPCDSPNVRTVSGVVVEVAACS